MSANSRSSHPPVRQGIRPGGFTLVELLASIGIIVFILSISILAVGPALRSASTKDAARRFRAALDSARVQAIQQRRAVRFEATRIKANPEQWAVASNVGSPQFEWYQLPEFVAVRTNAGNAEWTTEITGLSITFANDATIRAVTYSEGTTTTSLNSNQLTSQFLIRFHTLREASADEINLGACFIEVTPITGVLRSFGSDEADPDDLPKTK
ncbi:MAG TPA: GspH/FimT family pseudopilin [Planctomycetota bacterium]|nr:GspH/FimT family pseudopilin [Planctomycetota bacterium]HRR78603.1 GspH/FimT family pseudopilin [Planctomycetota bacterium]HRT94837.1 GspH/FimT family pseudopilin [Planctomycetota bacterium]